MGPKILPRHNTHRRQKWPYRQQRNQFKSRFWPPILWEPIGQLWGKYGKIPKNLLKVQTWCNNFHDFIATWKSRSEVWILTSFRSFTLDPMTVLLNGSGKKEQTLPWKKRKKPMGKEWSSRWLKGVYLIFSQAQIFFQSPISWCFPTSNCFYH